MFSQSYISPQKLGLLFFLLVALTACKEQTPQDEVFYFVLPDRFHNANPENDTGGIAGNREDHGHDASDSRFYHGGDLQGLRKKLPYLRNMGVTSIWLTPIFKNQPVSNDGAGYHGYWTVDYTTVDPHLGTNEDLRQLIKRAHKMGIKVFFDIVVNHTADLIRYEECHSTDGSLKPGRTDCPYVDQSQPAYTPFILPGREQDKVPAWLNDTAFYNNRGNSFFAGESSVYGDFFGLDDLNTQHPEVVAGMVDIFKFWISEFRIDGFRLDTVKHVDMSFWNTWAPAIQAHAADEGLDQFFIFGEIFDGNPEVISRYTTQASIPSALDFGLYFAARDVFAGGAGPQRLADMYAQDDWYLKPDGDASELLNFVSNHDVGRLGHYIQQQYPDAPDEEQLARLQLAYGLLYFGRGVPVIYYGDEQGFTGTGSDTGSREDMMPSEVAEYNSNDLLGTDATNADDNFDPRHPMYRRLREYKQVLDLHQPLRRGDMVVRYASDEPGILAFSRIEKQEPYEYLVVINTATTEQAVTLPATANRYQRIYSAHSSGNAALTADAMGDVTVSVAPLSVDIYRAKTPAAPVSVTAVTLELDTERKVNGRVEIPASVSWANESPLPLTRVRFEVSADGGPFELIGTDPNADYRVFYNADQHEQGVLLDFRAVATDGSGQEVVSAIETLEVGVEPGFTVYFQRPETWGENINVYYWNAEPAPAVNWPGLAAESLGEGWFKYQFPDGVSRANLIFNDGEGQQTADLYRDADGCYSLESDWTDSCDYPQPGLRVRFKKPDHWADSINIYYWNAGDAPAVDWPGTSMTALGNGWYEYRFPGGVDAANLIFNDGTGNQTADLYRDSDGCYGETADSWADSCDVPDQITVTISGARAHWVDSQTVLWDFTSSDAASYALHASEHATLAVVNNEIVGATNTFDLAAGAALSDAIRAKFRHLAEWPAFYLNVTQEQAKAALRGQLVAAAYDADGQLLEATRLQAPGAIDALFAYEGALGVDVTDGGVKLRLWAPTAQSVLLKRYDAAFNLLATEAPADINNGVYTFTGSTAWLDQYYRYEVSVYHPASEQIETYEVTDPYSVSLSMDSHYSQIVDLAGDVSLKPSGWDALVKDLPAHKDISVYEGHVRDFSAQDSTVPVEHRGTYLAFTYNGVSQPLSAGMTHLRTLQEAGLTHFHLLPVNDIATIQENPEHRVDLHDPYSRLCAEVDSVAVQEGCDEFGDTPIGEVFQQLAAADPVTERIQAINYGDRANGLPALDGFNWGYDPYHYNVPEGSYATDAAGKTRIYELRRMVQALHEVGLNVVVDVVYNHTSASGLWSQSVLDKIVPGYYHRRNPVTGAVENSTCCDNTAAEHAMMEKLMVDSVKTWAQFYKIDAFRFDLMGHHPKSTMERIQQGLATLTPVDHGVQGDRIYLYGEGWDFGEVAGNQRFDQATQFNLAGTGIGTFNDRLRDAVRGGNFTDRGRAQGYANGNELYPNGIAEGAAALVDQADRIRVGLAGNLQDYVFEDHTGALNTGVNYAGVGYTRDPQENVLYVDKHDNETLWDNTQAKLPDGLGMTDRVRVHALSQAFVNYAQGVPFHQMGSDLLRSKSMDRDSFDSGDWFNRVDFSLQSNNWAVGLPSDDKNRARWSTMRELMTNPNINPQPGHIQQATELFQEQLAIRYSSPLFRLDTEQAVVDRLGFLNTGTTQTPGIIAMTLSDGVCGGEDLDPAYDGIAVLFNADDVTQSFTAETLAGRSLVLHPLHQQGTDAVVKAAQYDAAAGVFTVPGRTAAVFVSPQTGAQGDFPCNPQRDALAAPGITVYFNNSDGWNNVNLYYWNTSPAQADVGWPGVPMNSLGDGWYSFTFPNDVAAANIIFNDGGGNQTADLYREGDGCYDVATNVWSDSCAVPGITFWFQKPAHWTDGVHLYFWNAGIAGPSWPGTPMTHLGDGWFTFQMPDGVRETNLIFNDAGPSGTGAQTADLSRNKDGCYSLDQGWADSCTTP